MAGESLTPGKIGQATSIASHMTLCGQMDRASISLMLLRHYRGLESSDPRYDIDTINCAS